MSDDKKLKEIESIAQEDMIPNPPKVDGKLKYYIIIFAIILAIVSALSVIFVGRNSDSEAEPMPNDTEVEYII